MSLEERDKQLRAALDFALQHSTDSKAMGALFGALATLVQTDDDAEALKLAQTGVLALLGRSFGSLSWRPCCGSCGMVFPAGPDQYTSKCPNPECGASWDGSEQRWAPR